MENTEYAVTFDWKKEKKILYLVLLCPLTTYSQPLNLLWIEKLGFYGLPSMHGQITLTIVRYA